MVAYGGAAIAVARVRGGLLGACNMGTGRTAINTLERSVDAETGSPTLSQPESMVSGRSRTTIKPWSSDVLLQLSSCSDRKSGNALHYRLAAEK